VTDDDGRGGDARDDGYGDDPYGEDTGGARYARGERSDPWARGGDAYDEDAEPAYRRSRSSRGPYGDRGYHDDDRGYGGDDRGYGGDDRTGGYDDYDDYDDHGGGDYYDDGDDQWDGVDDLLGERTAPVSRGARADRARPARRRTAAPKLIAVLMAVALLISGGIYGVGKVIGRFTGAPPDFPGPGEGGTVVQIASGATSREIGRVLAAAGIVASEGAFVDAAADDERALTIQPGYYRLPQRMSARGALDALLDPAVNALYRFTITEGMNVRQVIRELSKHTGVPAEEYQKVVDDPAPLGLPHYAKTAEGYLFPSTYDLVPGASPADTLKMFVAKFVREVAVLDLERAAPAVGLTPQDVVTVASIIEEEVANRDECPKVARVIYNRLNDDSGRFTRLDMDSTTRYAVGNFDRPLTAEQLRTRHPYNTRTVDGLPPGAISNPGLWALESALRPAKGTWLYFVSLPRSKKTIFATTPEEWEKAKARYRSEGGG
jgi:UPF0755 protein